MKPIHQELAALSADNPAGYIIKNAFAFFTLDKIIDIGKRMKGKEIPTGSGKLSTSLRDIFWANPHPTTTLVAPRMSAFPDTAVDLLISSDFEIVFDIFITGNTNSKVSEVRMMFTDVRVNVRAENNILIFEGSDFDVQRSILPVTGSETLLASAGIDPKEAAHIEGHIGYGVVSQAVSASLSARHEISLTSVFPAVNFGKSIKLAILLNGDALGIIPTETVVLNSSARCHCSDGTDLGLTDTILPDKKTLPTNVTTNTGFGNVVIGGPVAENKDPLKDFGQRYEDQGEIGIYIPQTFARSLVVEPMPSITFPAQDDSSVIGFNGRATVAFKNSKVSFDKTGGGILLDLDLDINATAYCDFEIFKGLRIPIGWAAILPTSPASLQMGFYPSIDSTGTLKLRSTLKKCDMGKYAAVVIGIGTALKFIGVTAWLGFLIDVVLAAIISYGLPIALKKEVSKYMANKEWKLIDGLPVMNIAEKMYPSAPFDVTDSSLLASVSLNG